MRPHWLLGQPLADLDLPVLNSGVECRLRDGRGTLADAAVAQIELRMMPRAFDALVVDEFAVCQRTTSMRAGAAKGQHLVTPAQQDQWHILIPNPDLRR